MPIYTYRCSDCGFQFDQQQKFTDPQLTRCPECGKKALHKVFQPVGIVFKGSGFYATDNRSPSGANRSSNNHKEDGESKSKENETKSEKDTEKSTEKSAEKTGASKD